MPVEQSVCVPSKAGAQHGDPPTTQVLNTDSEHVGVPPMQTPDTHVWLAEHAGEHGVEPPTHVPLTHVWLAEHVFRHESKLLTHTPFEHAVPVPQNPHDAPLSSTPQTHPRSAHERRTLGPGSTTHADTTLASAARNRP